MRGPLMTLAHVAAPEDVQRHAVAHQATFGFRQGTIPGVFPARVPVGLNHAARQTLRDTPHGNAPRQPQRTSAEPAVEYINPRPVRQLRSQRRKGTPGALGGRRPEERTRKPPAVLTRTAAPRRRRLVSAGARGQDALSHPPHHPDSSCCGRCLGGDRNCLLCNEPSEARAAGRRDSRWMLDQRVGLNADGSSALGLSIEPRSYVPPVVTPLPGDADRLADVVLRNARVSRAWCEACVRKRLNRWGRGTSLRAGEKQAGEEGHAGQRGGEASHHPPTHSQLTGRVWRRATPSSS